MTPQLSPPDTTNKILTTERKTCIPMHDLNTLTLSLQTILQSYSLPSNPSTMFLRNMNRPWSESLTEEYNRFFLVSAHFIPIISSISSGTSKFSSESYVWKRTLYRAVKFSRLIFSHTVRKCRLDGRSWGLYWFDPSYHQVSSSLLASSGYCKSVKIRLNPS